MLRSIDLASGSITASPTPGVKIFPRNGRGLGHVIIFGVKPRSKFHRCIDYATPGVKRV